MSYVPSNTAKRLIALLVNAKELSVQRQLRSSATSVVKACKSISETKKFGISPLSFDALIDGIKDKSGPVLLSMFASVEEAVVRKDMESQKPDRFKVEDNLDEYSRSPFLYLG